MVHSFKDFHHILEHLLMFFLKRKLEKVIWKSPIGSGSPACEEKVPISGGGKDQECLTVKDFTQEELLSILEPLLTRIPESGRPSWKTLLCSLMVTMSTWALLFTCLRAWPDKAVAFSVAGPVTCVTRGCRDQ
eukprot:s737_g31.t1